MKLENKHVLAYLDGGVKFILPTENERYDSFIECEDWRLTHNFDTAIEAGFKSALELKNMVLFQKELYLSFEDNELFLGQMMSSLGFEVDDVFLSEVKPILRDLSDLTKPITHNGETFVPMARLSGYESLKKTSISFCGYENKRYTIKLKVDNSTEFLIHSIPRDILSMDYFTVQKLLEWKFDIFGLLENNLAVPVTNEFNPYK